MFDTLETVGFVLLVAIGIAGLILPFLTYVVVGWQAKRKDILDGLTEDARQAYFDCFHRTGASSPETFEEVYLKWYGRRFFLPPGVLLCLVSITIVTLVAFTALHRQGYQGQKILFLPDTAIAAIAGAYLWVVNDFISRARRLDFSPADVQWGVLRLVIAVPMGYAFASLAPPVGPFVAFALGSFPLSGLNSMLQRLATTKLGLQQTPDEASDDISKLQGINKAIVERLANEDITTISQLAFCDPIDLVMRSSLTFSFVTDSMNQALAWLYLKEGLDVMRPLGLRGAVEIKTLMDAYDDADKADAARAADHDRALVAFPKVAAALKQDPETLQITFREICTKPHTQFLARVRNCT